MKKIIYGILVVSSILMLNACGKDIINKDMILEQNYTEDSRSGETILYAAIDNIHTKTMMSSFDGSWKPLWQDKDRICVFFDGINGENEFRLKAGAGMSKASFSGKGQGRVWTALYPFSDAISFDGKEIKMILPQEQTYSKGSFGPDSYPMVAAPTDGIMQFRNLCSTIKVQLKGHHIVDSIRFTASDRNISVCGSASVDVGFTEYPSLTMKSGGSGSVTLKVGGVLLSQDEITDFYIVLPPQTYRGGFTLKIFTPTGSMTRSTDADVRIERSKVHTLSPFTVKLDEGFEPSAYLEGNGTEDSPLLIKNLNDLLTMASAANANAEIRNAEGKNIAAATAAYRLEEDIDLAPVCSGNKGWTPIGGDNPFKGLFDGNGHRISNLYIDTDKPYTGFFGKMYGFVRNLSVSGTVKSTSTDAGIIAGHCSSKEDYYASVQNCTAYGEISSSYPSQEAYIGGVVGNLGYAFMSDCRNYATVQAGDYVGGITGIAGHEIFNCYNFGCVKGKSNCGGIVGFLFVGNVYNCTNYGDIDGDYNCGGIVGGLTGDGRVTNCLNTGDIYANSDKIGGIFGSSFNDIGQVVSNCVNVGTVLTPESFKGNKGGLAGTSEVRLTNCYWLYDPESNLGIRESVASGETENCFALTKEQIDGIENYFEPLYYNRNDIPSFNVIDALNNWAFDNIKSFNYWGWTFKQNDNWLSLTELPADPGQHDFSEVFLVSPSKVSITYEEYEFEVKVTAGMGHKLSSMPDWISVSDTHVTEAGGLTTTKYIFKAQANPDYVERSGVIILCNDAQQCVPVTVTQLEKIDEGDIWKTKHFYHRSVGLMFSATWCKNCLAQFKEWAFAKQLLGDKFQIAVFHPASSDLGFSQTAQMESAYGIAGYPSGIIDSRADVYGGTLIKPVSDETASCYGTSSGIEFVSTINGNNTIDLDIRLYIHEKGEYKVTALLLEDNIISGQQDAENGYQPNYRHNNIVRLAFSEVTGDKFTLSSDNSITSFKYSGAIPTECRTENLKILVYVEKAYNNTPKVTQVPGIVYVNYTGYYVDNANSAALGQKAEITFDDGTGKDEKYESKDYSADGKVTKLQSASVGNGIDIVITGDAFADKDQKVFEAYADRAMEAFFAVEPYSSLRNRFNVWRINAVSKNDYIGGSTKFFVKLEEDTRVEGNSDKVFSFVGDNIPSVDFTKTLIIVLANKTVYAGTCFSWMDNSTISFVPLQTSLTEFDATLRHESAGHGFGKLDDEYYYDKPAPADWIANRKQWQTMAYGFWENVDFTDDPETIRWKTFLNDSRYYGQVGIFEGGGTYATGVWRPTENSIMRYNYGFFNAPSREAIYKKIMRFSEGDSWKYDYETFVEFDAKGRKEEAAYYAVTKAYRAPAHKEVVPLHPPVLRER